MQPSLVSPACLALIAISCSSQAPECAIGVGKKCCWCCWKLYNWLSIWGDPATLALSHPPPGSPAGPQAVTVLDTSQDPEEWPAFKLHGTHGVVLPWAPPTIGMPIEFLETLRNTLLRMAADYALGK